MSENPTTDSHSEDRARSYAAAKRWVRLADFGITLAVLLVMVFLGWSAALREGSSALAASPVAALAIYFLGLTVLLQALTFPLDAYSGFVLEHRYNLSNQTIGAWLTDWLKGLMLSFALGLLGVEVVYFLLRWLGDNWWMAAATTFVLFFVLMAQLAPVLLLPIFYKFEPLGDEDLKGRLLKLSERAGARVRGVFLWRLSEKSKKANAALTGWGMTRRIILSDTLVEEHSPEEIEVVLAHEMGHHVHGDILRSILMHSALTFGGFYLAHLALRMWSQPLGFHSAADFANLPLLLLVSTGLSLVVLPFANAHSRWRERAADRFALDLTGLRDPFIGAMEKLATQNLAQRKPHPLIEFFFHSHPSIEKRVAFARTWEKK